eukprot:m.745676 g.745676  ORF g.745676 m.745676 type:complete len:150 (-) comp58958_c0_seq5:3508-3957(-)
MALIVTETDDDEWLAVFQEILGDFLHNSGQALVRGQTALQALKAEISRLARFFRFVSKTADTTAPSDDFFEIFACFLEGVHDAWRAYQRDVAKRQFDLVREQRQEMKSQLKTKKVNESTKSKLKAKFSSPRPTAQANPASAEKGTQEPS